MKLKTETEKVFVRSMGRLLTITAIFTDTDAANEYKAKHPDESVVAEFKPFIFLANRFDRGRGLVPNVAKGVSDV